MSREHAIAEIERIIGKRVLNRHRFFNTPRDVFGGRTLNQYLNINPRGALGTIKRMWT